MGGTGAFAAASTMATTGSVTTSSLSGALALGTGSLAVDDDVASASFRGAFVDETLQVTMASRQISA